MDKPTDYESVLRSSNLLRGTKLIISNSEIEEKSEIYSAGIFIRIIIFINIRDFHI